MVSTPTGMVTEVNLGHKEKALSPMLFTLEGMTTEVR